MPKVIKADWVLAEEEQFVMQTPSISAVNGADGEEQADDLIFFRKLPVQAIEDEDRRYYFKKNEPHVHVEETVAEEPAAEAVEEEVAGTAGEEPPEEPAEPEVTAEDKAREIIGQAQEEAREIVARAREEADRLIYEAKKEEEALMFKRAAEISEAEVKIEMAKSAANNIVAEANKQAEAAARAAEEKARELHSEAKDSGYAEGLKTGEENGHKQGFAKGEAEGLTAGREAGYKAGWDEGRAAGHTDAYNDTTAQMAGELAKASKRVKELLEDAEEEKTRVIASADDQIVKIAMAVAGKILNTNISENPFIILPIVQEAAKKLADQPRLFITVSASNYELVSAARDEIRKDLGGKQEITIVADNAFGPADVIISTGGGGDVDARLEMRLAEIKKNIEMVMRQ